MSKGNKKVFEVLENETISQCMDRIQSEGYTPFRRTEKPIFKEIMNGDTVSYEPIGRQILFEAKKND
ncbi:NETI motif-containing protein [Cytobacillus sp. FJAT-54145]|uniref:NETI motif-containing protein n=1 Tax=Cytobacillus spartinae TaxID=3299023 RepID=A0ABW6KAV9_9BACI